MDALIPFIDQLHSWCKCFLFGVFVGVMANPLVYYLVDRMADTLYLNEKIGTIGRYIDTMAKTEDAKFIFHHLSLIANTSK